MKKRIISFFTSLLMVFSVISAVPSDIQAAAVSEEALIRVIGESGQPGDKVYADIYVSDNPGVAAMCLDVSYDNNKLKLLSVTDGKLLGDSVATFGNDLSANPYRLCWDDSGNVNNNGNGILATLEFEILENATAEETEIYVAVQQGSTFDKDFNDVEFNTQHGVIFIEERQTVTTPQITTTISENITTTVTTTVNNNSSDVEVVVLLGDANLDGNLNVRDCAAIAGMLSKGSVDSLSANADFNEDGKINVRDAAAIAKCLAEKNNK